MEVKFLSLDVVACVSFFNSRGRWKSIVKNSTAKNCKESGGRGPERQNGRRRGRQMKI